MISSVKLNLYNTTLQHYKGLPSTRTEYNHIQMSAIIIKIKIKKKSFFCPMELHQNSWKEHQGTNTSR